MPINQILILVAMGAAFYFLLIRPQQQQAKRQAQTIASLEPGTRIVTIGGIYGTVVAVDEDRVRISVYDGSELEVIKRAVGSILPDEDEAEDADVDDDDEPEMLDAAEPTDASASETEGAGSDTSSNEGTSADA